MSDDKLTKRYICIMKQFDIDPSSSEKPVIVKLRHPRTRDSALFLFSPNNKIVEEIMLFGDDKPRSLFVDDRVISDGKIYFSTEIDPMFLVLPYIENNCNTRWNYLDSVLTDPDFPDTKRLLNCTRLNQIHQIAGIKDLGGGKKLYMYNEWKTLKWLEKKVTRIQLALKARNVTGLEISSSVDEDEKYKIGAFHMVGNYLSERLQKTLGIYLNIYASKKCNASKTSLNVPTGIEYKYSNGKTFITRTPRADAMPVKERVVKSSSLTQKSIADYFIK